MREHLRTPRNIGTVDDASGRGSAENAACGDRLEISARVEDGRVAEILFRATACSAVIATASLATETVQDLPVEEARALDVLELVREAGGLPPGKGHAASLVERALRSALA